MKIVIFASSPHKNGTSNTLVSVFAKGAKDIGRIYGVCCGTVSMMPKKYYEEVYNLGRDI